MTRFAAWMDGVAAFDEGLFRLSRAEAVGLDPQCRVLLENTWAALRDAAPGLGGTSPVSTGTYVGCVWSEFTALQDAARLKPTVASLTGSGLNFLVGRVSYTFGFQGMPCTSSSATAAWWLWWCPGAGADARPCAHQITALVFALCTPRPVTRRPLHRHGHCVLLLAGGGPSGPSRAAGRRDQRIG